MAEDLGNAHISDSCWGFLYRTLLQNKSLGSWTDLSASYIFYKRTTLGRSEGAQVYPSTNFQNIKSEFY